MLYYMPYMFYGGSSMYLYLVLVLPALILSIWAQMRVKSAYSKMSKVMASSGYTGAQAAAAMLRNKGILDVKIEQTRGQLSDHFDPRVNTIRLSEGVYNSTSLAAIGIACHEAGHAVQYAQGYAPIKFRNAIIKVTNIGSFAGIPLALIGFFMSVEPLIYIGLGLYSLIAVFQLVTLPVEFNASRRAVEVMNEIGLVRSQEEYKGAKRVLSAAALTYVAALAVTIGNLLRFIVIFTSGGNRRR